MSKLANEKIEIKTNTTTKLTIFSQRQLPLMVPKETSKAVAWFHFAHPFTYFLPPFQRRFTPSFGPYLPCHLTVILCYPFRNPSAAFLFSPSTLCSISIKAFLLSASPLTRSPKATRTSLYAPKVTAVYLRFFLYCC